MGMFSTLTLPFVLLLLFEGLFGLKPLMRFDRIWFSLTYRLKEI